ncbi:MAG: N-acetylmuramidase domain-containing protein [Candidatus Korobacteraceae bacterium]
MAACLSQPVAHAPAPSNTVAPPFFSQRPDLQQANPAPAPVLSPQAGWNACQSALARTYNRLGGLIARLAALAGVPLPAALAVWFVESSGRALEPNRALIRFEVHHLWSAWGYKNPALFDAHFQFGGHAGTAGHPWQAHAYRASTDGAFAPVHNGQTSEYAALQLAMQLAGEELAVRCISVGGCQLLGCDYDLLGYPTAKAMYDAFQSNESAHVLGFFDFCARQPAPHIGGLLTYLRQQDFASFAHFYNGGGEVAAYAAQLRNAAADAESVLATG